MRNTAMKKRTDNTRKPEDLEQQAKGIAVRIREIRNHHKLNVFQLSQLCQLSPYVISAYERADVTVPYQGCLERLSAVFGVSSEWLLTGKGDKWENKMASLLPPKEFQVPVKDYESYLEEKNKNLLLEQQLEKLWQMLGQFIKKQELVSENTFTPVLNTRSHDQPHPLF
jgi:transcriptional regulator with XRE-family HTH domain